MSTLKRLSFILLFILFLLSIRDDLSKQPTVEYSNTPEVVTTELQPGIAHIKIEPGDTIISVTKTINDSDELNTEQIIDDFKRLNPGVDIEALIPHSFYSFPLYNE